MDENATTDDTKPGRTLAVIGSAISLAGIVGTIMVIAEMSNDDEVAYDTVNQWLAGFAGLTVIALGAILAGVGTIVAKLSDGR